MPKQSGPEVKFLWTAGLTYGFFPVFYVDTGKFSLQNKCHFMTTPAIRVLMGVTRGLPGSSKWGGLVLLDLTLAMWKVFFCFSLVKCCWALASTAAPVSCRSSPIPAPGWAVLLEVLLPAFIHPPATVGCAGAAAGTGKNTRCWQMDNPNHRQCFDLLNFLFRSKWFHLSPEMLKGVGERVPGVIWAPGMLTASQGLRGACTEREEEEKICQCREQGNQDLITFVGVL